MKSVASEYSFKAFFAEGSGEYVSLVFKSINSFNFPDLRQN